MFDRATPALRRSGNPESASAFLLSNNPPPQRFVPHTQPLPLLLPLAFLSFPRLVLWRLGGAGADVAAGVQRHY